MKKEIEINLSLALIISQVINKLMFVESKVLGNTDRVYPRELPDRLKFALEYNKKMFDRDIAYYDEERQKIILRYSFLPPEKFKEKYREELGLLLMEVIKHNIQVIHSDDLDLIKDKVDVTYEQLDIFLRIMCDNPTEESTVENTK